jgi:hypothetical protein
MRQHSLNICRGIKDVGVSHLSGNLLKKLFSWSVGSGGDCAYPLSEKRLGGYIGYVKGLCCLMLHLRSDGTALRHMSANSFRGTVDVASCMTSQHYDSAPSISCELGKFPVQDLCKV